jgi:PAS domain S-box-containing protein
LIDVAGEKCLLSIFNDVTEIKWLNALCGRTRKSSKRLSELAGLMSISTLEDGRYIEVNDVFLDAIGFSREEVIGKTSKELGIFVDYGQREGMRKILSEQGSSEI